jgi:ATP-dependent DNA helicase DinG
MKGRGNYLCRKKLYDLTDRPVLNGLEEIDQFRSIKEWEAITTTGDRAELAAVPESSLLWPKLDARADSCVGTKCKEYERCFITEMRRTAAESDIIIVNHHLYFADLSIKQAAENAPDVGILPEAAAVIFDEAHELEDVAGSYFGVTASNVRVDDLVRDVEFAIKEFHIASPTLLQAAHRLRERSQLFFTLLPQGDGRFAFENRREFLEENGEEFLAFQNALAHLYGEVQAVKEKPDELFNLARRTEELRVQLSFLMESNDRNTVYWIERRGEGRRGGRGNQNVFLQATPIDVSSILQHTLFANLNTAVLTSATIAVGGGFQYARGRLGLIDSRELIVPSHFDYETQAVFYVPPDMPDPREPSFSRKAADRIRQLLTVTRGRAFCLFTSYAQMNDVYDRLLGELDYPMLKQGDAPKSALLEEFRMTPGAVLFATSSFWQGVDVQGEQLSCVIIDRLPFAVPNDPVVSARMRAIEEDGRKPFFDYQVPNAVITLKQGFGRLIRSLEDRGVLVLLDPGIQRKHYGKVFLESLPPYRMTKDIGAVEEFFATQKND